jgi:hypothetical protein
LAETGKTGIALKFQQDSRWIKVSQGGPAHPDGPLAKKANIVHSYCSPPC